jgi:hypothetical protein
MNRNPYNTDVSDEEWTIPEPLIPASQTGDYPFGKELRNVHVFAVCAKSLTQSSTYNVLAVLGAYFRMNFHLGKRCIITFALGVSRVCEE